MAKFAINPLDDNTVLTKTKIWKQPNLTTYLFEYRTGQTKTFSVYFI